MDDLDAETKEDKTDYIATITPELLNLSSKSQPKMHCSKFEYKTSCSFSNYILVFILFFLLLQIILKLKVIHYKICSILAILVTFNKKPEEKSSVDCIPNLNYIIDILHQFDKKCKND
jgi:hypothetical protein